MTLGWNLTDDADVEYRIPYDAGLTTLQSRLFEKTLQAYVANHLPLAQNLRRVLEEQCALQGVRCNEDAGKKIVFLAQLQLEGFGALSYPLSDDELEEIAVPGLNKPVFVCHRTRGWLKTNLVIEQLEFAIDVVNKMARPQGRRLTYQQPRLSAVLEDGSRLHACSSPVAKDGFSLTLRKFRRARFSVKELIDTHYLSVAQAAFLWILLESESSLLIAGNTASGKTTLLNALSAFVPKKERIVVIEEAPELSWPHPHQVRMVENQDVGATLGVLAQDSLRMRPDRVVLGEVRSAAESKALFDILLSGHAKGAYATFHADSSAEALVRFTSLGIRPEDFEALDAIIVARRGRLGRKVSEVAWVENKLCHLVFSDGNEIKIAEAFFKSPLFDGLGMTKSQFVNLLTLRKKHLLEAPTDASEFEIFIRERS